MIEQLIARAFASRNCAHLTHWKTRSLAEHLATGEFYDEVIDIIDNLVECYQGNFGLIKDVQLSVHKGDILTCLEADAIWIDENEDAICGEVDALENILQELQALYLKTIYKLKFLS